MRELRGGIQSGPSRGGEASRTGQPQQRGTRPDNRRGGNKVPGMRRKTIQELPFQPHVQDHHRRGQEGENRLPETRNGTGDVHHIQPFIQVPQGETPVRCGPDWQGLPQRNLPAAGLHTDAGVQHGGDRDILRPGEQGLAPL